MLESIYLDHNATTPLDPEVREAMDRASVEGFANPASQHASGRRARRLLEDSRERIAELLGASLHRTTKDQLLFTSGGTEANNLAIFGLTGGDSGIVVASAVEHPSVANPVAELERRGWRVERLGVDSQGRLRLDQLESSCALKPQLMTLMFANNETGVIQPIAEAAQICRSYGVPLHCDAVQAVGKLDLDFRQLEVSSLAFAAHKFNGPRGIGALLVRSEWQLRPLLFGGAQQQGARPGTECTVLAVGMCRALEIWQRNRSARCQRLTALRDRFQGGLCDAFPDMVVHGAGAECLANTLSVSLPGLDRQALVMALDLAGIECSTGSACASGSSELSTTLKAMGMDNALIQAAVRFSFGWQQSFEEIETALNRTIEVVKRLRK